MSDEILDELETPKPEEETPSLTRIGCFYSAILVMITITMIVIVSGFLGKFDGGYIWYPYLRFSGVELFLSVVFTLVNLYFISYYKEYNFNSRKLFLLVSGITELVLIVIIFVSALESLIGEWRLISSIFKRSLACIPFAICNGLFAVTIFLFKKKQTENGLIALLVSLLLLCSLRYISDSANIVMSYF